MEALAGFRILGEKSELRRGRCSGYLKNTSRRNITLRVDARAASGTATSGHHGELAQRTRRPGPRLRTWLRRLRPVAVGVIVRADSCHAHGSASSTTLRCDTWATPNRTCPKRPPGLGRDQPACVAPTGVVRCRLLSEGAPLNYHEAPVSLNGGRFDLSILMTGNQDEAMRRCAHCLVFLQVEPDRLDTRLVSTFAEELPLSRAPSRGATTSRTRSLTSRKRIWLRRCCASSRNPTLPGRLLAPVYLLACELKTDDKKVTTRKSRQESDDTKGTTNMSPMSSGRDEKQWRFVTSHTQRASLYRP